MALRHWTGWLVFAAALGIPAVANVDADRRAAPTALAQAAITATPAPQPAPSAPAVEPRPAGTLEAAAAPPAPEAESETEAEAADPEAEKRFCHSLAAPDGSASEVCIEEARYFASVCAAIATYAARWRLPAAYFARLIWQESRFDPFAISPAGAQGIAQFMPSTARLRGLPDPFQPASALAYSAEYLRFLTDKFGNLGLAAAAYNAGENAVAGWQAGSRGLVAETRNYVEIITGRSVDVWRDPPEQAINYDLDPERPFEQACITMAEAQPMPRLDEAPATWRPWGVQIAQNFSASVARAAFERAQSRHASLLSGEELLLLTVRNPNFGRKQRFAAQVGRDTRSEAEALCAKLRAAGGACVVTKN